MTSLSPRAAYERALSQDGFHPDPAQQHAVDMLENCYQALNGSGPTPRGVYLWGPVGRGKTWLMNRFHDSLSVPSRRQHFHHFMRWVHRRLFQLTGTPDPLRELAAELAGEIRVLCFDEFFVSDIGDAMILGRLISLLFEYQVVLVATSNQPPQQLYADGFHRDRFLPAIDAIIENMEVVDVDGSQDHRLHPGETVQRYWVREPGQGSVLGEVFTRLNGDGAATDTPVAIGSRQVSIVQQGERVLQCSYDQLCEQPLAASDYIELCDRYRHILLSGVPCLAAKQNLATIARGTEDAAERVETGDRKLPKQSKRDNGVRRFISLVDECYDRGVPLYIEAEVPMDQLYPHGYLAFPFRRALSRLKEMQYRRFERA